MKPHLNEKQLLAHIENQINLSLKNLKRQEKALAYKCPSVISFKDHLITLTKKEEKQRLENFPRTVSLVRRALENSIGLVSELGFHLSILKARAYENGDMIKMNSEILDKVKVYESQKIPSILNHVNSLSTCLLSFEIENSSMAEERKQKIMSIAQDLFKKKVNKHQTFFESIFNDYWRKESLSTNDEFILSKIYSLWSSQFEQERDYNLNSRQGLPFFNVNPHNASFFYWMKAKALGLTPEKSIPLMHADTHKDLGHIHAHVNHDIFKPLKFSDFEKMINIFSRWRQGLITSPKAFKEELLSFRAVQEKSSLEHFIKHSFIPTIIEEVYSALRKSVYTIAQPMVASVAANLSNNLIFVLPPWSQPWEIGYSPIVDSLALPTKGYLVQRVEQNSLYESRYEESLCVYADKEPMTFNYKKRNSKPSFHRFLENKEEFFSDPKNSLVKTFNLFFAPANSENQVIESSKEKYYAKTIQNTQVLPEFSSYLAQSGSSMKKFILDLDLDVFVSDGYYSAQGRGVKSLKPTHHFEHRTRIETPHSYERTAHLKNMKSLRIGFEHDLEDSLDPSQEISVTSLEFKLIKERIDSFFERLKISKKQGYVPAIITVSDSTSLRPVTVNNVDDDLVAGIGYKKANYTPKSLVFLINYQVRRKIKEIYPEVNLLF